MIDGKKGEIMRTKKSIIWLLSGTMALFLAFGISSCKKDDRERINYAAPELTIADDGIYWATITGATAYEYKYGNGEWMTAQLPLSFPTSDGEYVLYIKAVGNDGKEGLVKEFPFEVKTASASVTQVDNALVFEGDKIAYSVNGGEEGVLETNKTLDFSLADVGTKFSVSYYAKANYWSSADVTYYKDSERKSVELTVSSQLAAPTLKVNALGTGIEWLASENAASYEVTVDGVKTSVPKENPRVDFPMTVGEHLITVKAIGEGEWSSSYVSEYAFQTLENSTPSIIYDDFNKKIVWDAAYVGKVKKTTDGVNFTSVSGTDILATDGLQIKISAFFDETKRTYYLESNAILVEKRETPSISFNSEGLFVWGGEDENYFKSYNVSIVGKGESPVFKNTVNNATDVSVYSAGEYCFSVRNASCVENDGNTITLYIPSDTVTANFTVLEKPSLSYSNGKLVWEHDNAAESYQYKKDDGEWSEVATQGNVVADGIGEYSIRAMGSEIAPYSVTSGVSSLFFDPLLKDTSTGSFDYYDLALFNHKAYEKTVSTCEHSASSQSGVSEILLSSTDGAEAEILAGSNDGGVLKVTAGSTKKFAAHWASSDGVKFSLFQSKKLSLDSEIIFRIYIKGNAARESIPTVDGDGNPVLDDGGNPTYHSIEGDFAFGAGGLNKKTGSGYFSDATWYNDTGSPKLEVNKWIEVSVRMGEYYIGIAKDGISDLQSVFCYFIANGQEGDVFYIDEIRYAAGITSETNEDRQTHAAPTILESATSYQVMANESIPVYTNEGETADGKYVKVHAPSRISNAKFFQINYNNVALNAGDVLLIKIKQYQRNEDLQRSNSTINFYVNGEYKNWVASVGEIVEVKITMTAATILKTLEFYAPNTALSTRGRFTFEVYGVDILSSSQVNVEEYTAPTSFVGAKNVTVELPETVSYNLTTGSDATGNYLHFESVDRIAGTDKVMMSVNYDDITLNANDTVTVTLKMFPHTTQNTDYTSPLHFYVNDAHVNWSEKSGEVFTFTYTAKQTTTLKNVQLRSQNSSLGKYGYFNFYVYGIEIVKG